MTTKEEITREFDRMVEEWGSRFVTRSQVEKFTGGIMNANTLQKMDQTGRIPGKFYIGRKTCYPVKEIVKHLVSKIRVDFNKKESIHG